MQGHELEALRRLLMYSREEAARYLGADDRNPKGVEERTWNRWEAGDRVPQFIVARVRAMMDARARFIEDQRRSSAAGERPLVLWYREADDMVGDRAYWRPWCSAVAQLYSEGTVRVVLFDGPAYARWRTGHSRADDVATRAEWTRLQALDQPSISPAAGRGTP